MSLKFAIFDVDGTLVDSRRTIAVAMDEAFTAMGLPAPGYDATRKIVGLSLVPAIQRLAPDLPQERWPELGLEYKNAFIRMRTENPKAVDPLYDGARELLQRLRDDGWVMGIATGKARRGVEAFLNSHDLHGWFDAAYCADDGPGKPDPHMLHLNLKATGMSAADAVMIGDTSFDMEMARAANIYAQGVAWGFHTVDEVKSGGAHHVADDFAALEAELHAFAEADSGLRRRRMT